MTLKQTCKEVGITVQQYQTWLRRAKDAKCEYLFITLEDGEDKPYPYHVNKREYVDTEREFLATQNIKILLEVMI